MDGAPYYSHSSFNVGFGRGELCGADKVDIEEYKDFIHTHTIYIYIYNVCNNN